MTKRKNVMWTEGELPQVRLQAKAAASVLGVTPRYLSTLVQNGHIKKINDEYALIQTVQGYVASLKIESKANTNVAKHGALTDLRTREMELKILEREDGMVIAAREEALSIITEVVGGLKADLMAIAAKVTLDLSIRKKVEDLILEAIATSQGKAKSRASGLDESLADLDDSEGELAA